MKKLASEKASFRTVHSFSRRLPVGTWICCSNQQAAKKGCHDKEACPQTKCRILAMATSCMIHIRRQNLRLNRLMKEDISISAHFALKLKTLFSAIIISPCPMITFLAMLSICSFSAPARISCNVPHAKTFSPIQDIFCRTSSLSSPASPNQAITWLAFWYIESMRGICTLFSSMSCWLMQTASIQRRALFTFF